MARNVLERRQMERDAFCRACDKVIKRNTEEAIIWYSWRNKGQHIMICLPCSQKIGEMAGEVYDKNTNDCS